MQAYLSSELISFESSKNGHFLKLTELSRIIKIRNINLTKNSCRELLAYNSTLACDW